MDKTDLEVNHNEDIDPMISQPQQVEMPFAIVDGESMTELPSDLYIPPVALKVILSPRQMEVSLGKIVRSQ